MSDMYFFYRKHCPRPRASCSLAVVISVYTPTVSTLIIEIQPRISVHVHAYIHM